MSPASPFALDAAFFALADATRRAVIRELLREPLRAGELAERVEMSPPALSRHLRVLREAGLIAEEHEQLAAFKDYAEAPPLPPRIGALGPRRRRRAPSRPPLERVPPVRGAARLAGAARRVGAVPGDEHGRRRARRSGGFPRRGHR